MWAKSQQRMVWIKAWERPRVDGDATAVLHIAMTAHRRTKQLILQKIKALTNNGRHAEAMGLYQRHFGLASAPAR